MSTEPEIVAETADILAMFAVIERSYDALSERGKRLVDEEKARTAAGFGFEGFDGNHDPHGYIAPQIAKLGDYFGQVADRADLNSHTSASIVVYRRMLRTYQQLRWEHDLRPSVNLTADQINTVLSSRWVSAET